MNKRKPNTSAGAGFTLIELMGVILLIAILLTVTMVAANRLLMAARKHRIHMMKNTLENAISRYYDDYGKWPCSSMADYDKIANGETMQKGKWNFQKVIGWPGRNEDAYAGNDDSDWAWFSASAGESYVDGGIAFGGEKIGSSMSGGDNTAILNALLKDHPANNREITYVDETGFSVWNPAKTEPMRLSDRSGASVGSWCFRDLDGKVRAFKVVLSPIDHKVRVGTGRKLP